MKRPELVCPAGTPAALRTAVDAGADAVYCGFRNATNARNFPGLNFTVDELRQSVSYAHERRAGCWGRSAGARPCPPLRRH